MKQLIANYFDRHPQVKWNFDLFRHGRERYFDLNLPHYLKKDVNAGTDFVFIVGSGRCGSTLLRRLLMEKADIYIPPETYVLAQSYLEILRSREKEWCDLVRYMTHRFESHPEFVTFGDISLREFCQSACKWQSADQNIARLLQDLYIYLGNALGIQATWAGDKTPIYTFSLGVIRKMMPNAKYIYLLRDGVDVAVSCREVGRYASLEEGAHRWIKSQRSWAAFKKSLSTGEGMEIRYEDMVVEPDRTVERIMSKFRMPKRMKRIDVVDRLGDVQLHSHHSAVLQEVNSSSMGKGRRNICQSERKSLGPVLNDSLVKSGYRAI